jgi:autotransporter-associated beta strand protein
LFLQQTNSGISPKGLYIQQTATNGIANIAGGTLICEGIRVMNANSLAAGATPPTATLNVSGGDLFLGANGVSKPGTLASGIATANLSGGTFHTTNSLSPGGDVNWAWNANLPANLTNSPSPGVVTFAPGVGRTITLSNIFSGTGGLAVAGPGTVDIEGANTYTGNTTLSGGTLSGFGSVQGSVTANSGSTIAPGNPIVPATLTLGNSLTLNNNTNVMKLASDPTQVNNGVGDFIMVNGQLTLQSLSTVKVVPIGPLSASSPYTLMQYSGTPLLPTDVAKLHVISDSPRYSFSVVSPAASYPYIQINVSGNSANLVWRGGKAPSPNTWDQSTTNWLNTGTSAFDVFYDGDVTVFDDTGTVSSINVVGSEQPTLISMQNGTVSYTFSGTGLLTGPLDMEGTGTLTLALSQAPTFTAITNDTETLIFDFSNGVANTISAPIYDNGGGAGTIIQGGTNTVVLSGVNSGYAGKILVTNGVLQYTDPTSLGAATAALYVTNNGTLDLNRVNAGTKPIHLSGAGFNGMGALADSNGNLNQNNIIASITLEGDTTFGSNGRWDQAASGSSFTGNGYNLTTIGTGVMLLNNAGATGLGNIHVVGSRLGFENTIDLGDPTKTVTVESAGLLTLFAIANPAGKNMVLNNGATLDSGGGVNTFTGPVALTGTNVLSLRTDLHLSGVVSGTGGWTVSTNSSVGNGNGALCLDSASPNTYSGVTIMNAGSRITVGANSSLGTSSLISLNTGSTLDVSAPSAFNLGTGQALIGLGTVNGGNTTFGSGSTLSIGLSATAVATLTVNGNLTFQPGSTNRFKVNPSGAGSSDLVTGPSSVAFDGTLVVTKVGSGTFAAGNSFQLFSSVSYSGSFASVSLPPLPAGLRWDTSGPGGSGTIKVIAQPQITGAERLGNGTVELTFTADPSSPTYILWATTNVALPLASWTQLSSGSISSSPMTVQDPTAANYPRRFYTISVR